MRNNTFQTPLEAEQIPNRMRWVVVRELRYIDPWGTPITVPAGFTTDYASVPPLARIGAVVAAMASVLARPWPWFYVLVAFALWVCFISEWMENSGTDEIATVHDYLYATRKYPRWKADAVLYYGMVARGATSNPFWKQVLFWLNVRLFGWIPWVNDAKKTHRQK